MSQLRHVFALSVLLFAGCGSREDDALILDFQRDRAKYDNLVAMFAEDVGLGRVAMEYTLPTNPGDADISFDRIKQYRALCAELRAEGCLESFDEDRTTLWIHREPHPQSFVGTRKGFLFSEEPPFPVVENFDDLNPDAPGTWLQHIDGPWYLYLENRT